MKKILLLVLSISLTFAGFAQTFVPNSGAADTVWGQYVSGTGVQVNNYIASTSSTSVVLKWKVVAVAYDAGWDAAATGICDNYNCYYDVNSLMTGALKYSFPYTTTQGDFHVAFTANNPAPGTKALVTVRATDSATGYTRNLTFIAYRAALGVGQTNLGDNGVTLYPNPARESVNVLFSKDADIKTIAIFNLIGKTVRVFKPTDNSSAKLDLDNIPSGVYFVRLMDGKGQVVATRRFTRQ